jgi:hypothetical protein
MVPSSKHRIALGRDFFSKIHYRAQKGACAGECKLYVTHCLWP